MLSVGVLIGTEMMQLRLMQALSLRLHQKSYQQRFVNKQLRVGRSTFSSIPLPILSTRTFKRSINRGQLMERSMPIDTLVSVAVDR